MKKKLVTAVSVSALLIGSLSSTALAFNDLHDVPQAAKILDLKERGFVNGIEKDLFAPHQKLNAEQAIPLIVKSLQLSLAHLTFIKAPVASDVFTNIPDDAWYAEAFVIAHHNGIPIDPDIVASEPVTREQFLNWLIHGVNATGQYPMIKIYHFVGDEDQVSDGYMGSIQQALSSKIITLDEDGNFRPQDPITRAEAAEMVRNSVQFIEDMNKEPVEEPQVDPIEAGEITVAYEEVTPEIQKVILDMGERPHPGWGVKIEGIDFIDEDSAVIRYSVTYPDPAALYPMVITYPKAETILSAEYKDIQFQLTAVYDRILEPEAPIIDEDESSADIVDENENQTENESSSDIADETSAQ